MAPNAENIVDNKKVHMKTRQKIHQEVPPCTLIPYYPNYYFLSLKKNKNGLLPHSPQSHSGSFVEAKHSTNLLSSAFALFCINNLSKTLNHCFCFVSTGFVCLFILKMFFKKLVLFLFFLL